MTTAEMPLDTAAAEAFAAKMIGVINSAGLALMISIGHRTRLFNALADLPPSTSLQVAEAAGLNERYVREWLGAMTTGGIVEYDAEEKTYWLPPEHAVLLVRGAVPSSLASPMQWVAVLGAVEDQVVDAFRHGKGVPYSAYRRFHEVMAEESEKTTVAALEEHILPLVPDLRRRLEEGIDVLDVGCGSGHALRKMAQLFPRSRFVGYDFWAEGVAASNAVAVREGLENLRFECQDAAAIELLAKFDLVTAFDAIHDQAHPGKVLRNIHRVLKKDGLFLMQDIKACSHVHGNRDLPLGPFTYTISCMHCMSVSLANGGVGLGAAWGKELALQMLAEAGFADVRVETLPHDILNYYYVALPSR